MIDDLYTRFRAYYMPHGGISMSYMVDSSFTLIEARYNDDNILKIKSEMELAGCTSIDLLHVSNWSREFCDSGEIEKLLQDLQPLEVEIPGYEPTDDNGRQCRKLIREYCNRSDLSELFEAGPKTLEDPATLPDADFTDLIFSPLKKYDDEDDNSVIKIFRQGKFSLLNVSKSNKANEVIESLNKTGMTSFVDVLLTYYSDELNRNDFIDGTFLDVVNPQMIALAGKEPQLMVKKNNNLEDRGIRASRTEQGDILVKYGIMSRKERLNLEKGNSVGNGEYQKLINEK